MTYTTYTDADGLKKNRKVRGAGTTGDPYEGYSYDVELNTTTGTRTQIPADKATLTTTGGTAYSIIQLLKGILLNSGSTGGGSTSLVYSQAVDVTPVVITATSPALVTEINTADWNYLSLWIQNTGTDALNELITEAGFSATLTSKYAYLAGAAATGSYGSGTGKQSNNTLIPIIFANNLPALASGADGFIELDVRRYERIRFRASVASGSATLAINGLLKR